VGGIDFAIIEDRKFKSGPLEFFPQRLSKGRADLPKKTNAASLDHPDAVLLGKRQLKFLDEWGRDWTGAQMKCVLSQTIFCQGHTMNPIDLDTNGWPQSGRNRALGTIRKSFAFMLGGDQHLATVIHHGIDDFGDAGYSFCVPSIVNHYPRKWAPTFKPVRKIAGPLEGLGDYRDGLGNKITMHAHANPNAVKPPIKSMNPRVRQATGHGIVRFNKSDRTITMECWPRGTDTTRPDARQYPGWPIKIRQMDNYGRDAKAFLPLLKISGEVDPVVQVISEESNEVIYTLRIKGNRFRPKVFKDGTYTIKIGEGRNVKMLKGVQSIDANEAKSIQVDMTD
jgi:hypothetical protein